MLTLTGRVRQALRLASEKDVPSFTFRQEEIPPGTHRRIDDCRMASYHLSVKPISRSDGRSATAAAAYRAAARIECEREGRVHDYTRRGGVEHVELVMPRGALVLDRQALWNAAEAAERRKDGRVAREFEIALPVELSAESRRSLAISFANEIASRHGCAVDVAIHSPARGDDRNHHAHLLTTTRRLGPEGLGAKCRELDDIKTGPQEVEHWRARWAQLQNSALEHAGFDARVEHKGRSLDQVERGFEPTQHLGPSASEMERRGAPSERGDFNRAVANRNQERQTLHALIAEQEGQIRVRAMTKRERPKPAVRVPVLIPALPVTIPALTAEAVRIDALLQDLIVRRTQQIERVLAKARVREDRRIDALERMKAEEPVAPTGWKARLPNPALDRATAAWYERAKPLEVLAQQARALRQRLVEALQQVRAWVETQRGKTVPATKGRGDADRVAPVVDAAVRSADPSGRPAAANRAIDRPRYEQTRMLVDYVWQVAAGTSTDQQAALHHGHAMREVFERYRVLRQGGSIAEASKRLAVELYEASIRHAQAGGVEQGSVASLPLLDRVQLEKQQMRVEIQRPAPDPELDR